MQCLVKLENVGKHRDIKLDTDDERKHWWLSKRKYH